MRTYDIETYDWDKFVCGGIYDSDNDSFVVGHTEGEYHSLFSPGEYYAWNGGRFDALWYLDYTRRIHGEKYIRRNIRVREYGARIGLLEDTIRGVKLLDACALIPLGLAAAAKIVGKEKLDMDYAGIGPNMPADRYRVLLEYLEQDCRLVADIVSTVVDTWESYGWDVRATLASTSWASAQLAHDVPKAEWLSGADYRFARKAYIGGRVLCANRYASTGVSYDINSAYPAALVNVDMPFGSYREVSDSSAKRAFSSGVEGVYQARVSVPPDMYLPVLGTRLADRVYYCTGTFTGTWTANELRYAASNGTRILDLYKALIWDTASRPFADFMLSGFARRRELESAGNPTLGGLTKRLICALGGKTGQRPDHTSVRFGGRPRMCPARALCGGDHCARQRNMCCTEHCSGSCGKWKLVRPGIYLVPQYTIPACGHVQIAAYMTAAARIELHRVASQCGEQLLYCDTDSVKTVSPPADIDIGPGLGQWGYEGAIADWHGAAPKLYRMRLDSAEVVKSKGVNLPYSAFDDYVTGASVDIAAPGVRSLRQALRGGGSLFSRRKLIRQHTVDTIWCGDRIRVGDGTRPATYAEAISRRRRKNAQDD